MSEMVPFSYGLHEVRVLDVGGEPWFVARDVCLQLGYANANDAIARHCKGVVKRDIPTTSGVQSISTIPERDVYRLVMRSKLPNAQSFEEWVVGEVLPTIRRTGSYGRAADPLAALNDPAALRTLLLGYSDRVIALESTVAAQAPKVAALDRIATATEGSYSVREAAKSLGLGPKVFTGWLVDNRWIYRHPDGGRWLAFQPRLYDGLLEHKVVTGQRTDGTDWGTTQVRVTAKGLARISVRLEREAVPC